MDFLKKHYEKVVLSVVLLALAAAAGAVPVMITQTQKEISEMTSEVEEGIRQGDRIEYSPVNLEEYRTNLQAISNVPELDVSGDHNLLNPVNWKMGSEGRLYKETELGAGAFKVTGIRPLYTGITFKGVSGGGESIRYRVGIALEASDVPRFRDEMTRFVQPNEEYPAHPFILREVQGPSENPDALVLELKDTNEEVTITPSDGAQRMEGYAADLTHPLARRPFEDQRKGDTLRVNGEQYKIVAITENTVTVEAESGKRTNITANSAQ